MVEKENKKILVWNGIFQGYKYITKEEQKDREILQQKMRNDIINNCIRVLKWFGIGLILFIILIWIWLSTLK